MFNSYPFYLFFVAGCFLSGCRAKSDTQPETLPVAVVEEVVVKKEYKKWDSIVYIGSEIFEAFDPALAVDSIMGTYLRNLAGASVYARNDRSTIQPVKIEDRYCFNPMTFNLYKKNASDSLYLVYASAFNDVWTDSVRYSYYFSTWMYVDPADFVTSRKDVRLKSEELTLASYFYDTTWRQIYTTKYFPGKVDSLVRITIINKKEYDSFKNKQINYLIRDTSNVKKEEKGIRLPLDHNKDTVLSGADYYRYVPVFDSYAVGFAGNEVYNYVLIHRDSAQTLINSDLGFPHISPNRKYVINLGENGYQNEADFTVYRINGLAFDFLHSISFIGWMPVFDVYDQFEEHIVWVNDTSFMVKVIHPFWFFDYMDEPDPRLIEYIKIEMLDRCLHY